MNQFLEKLKVRRGTSLLCSQWLGVGLEAAQLVGALPAELTEAQKMERPRQAAARKIEVVRDEVWKSDQRNFHITNGAHPSHSLHKVGDVHFCAVCGCYGAQKLVALSNLCEQVATPSRRYLLKKMLAGCHPRTGEYLGEIARAGPVAAQPFTAPQRRSHRAEVLEDAAGCAVCVASGRSGCPDELGQLDVYSSRPKAHPVFVGCCPRARFVGPKKALTNGRCLRARELC